jgi:mRNA interferase YafQ
MLKPRYSNQFKRDYKLAKKRHLPVDDLKGIIIRLCDEEVLEQKYHDHALSGNWKGFRECHIQPEWLLIYRIDHGEMILVAQRTGSHSELFDM